MDIGEFLTRASVWIALIGYWIATLLLIRGRTENQTIARWVWTVGCVAAGLHFIFAFQFFHDWSHADAIRETARQTSEFTGIDSGAGLYLNYLFVFLWIGDDIAWWRMGTARYLNRAWWIHLTLHGFLLFMIVNGAVIFAAGSVRVLGILIVGSMLLVPALKYFRRK